MRHFSRVAAFAAFVCLILSASPRNGFAIEESKIIAPLENVSGDPASRASGQLHSTFLANRALFRVRLRSLAPSTDYLMLAGGTEMAHILTDANGHANVQFDLLNPSSPNLTQIIDPRGKLISINDGTQDILAAVFSGPLEPPRTKVKERTQLTAVSGVEQGRVEARFDRLPNGRGKFVVSSRSLAVGDYELCVDGVPLAEFTTNAGGNAMLSFMSHLPNNGNNNGNGNKPRHNQKHALDFDPRGELVEVKQDGNPVFSGPMLAQVLGLNICEAISTLVPLALAPGQLIGQANFELGIADDCSDFLIVTVQDVAAGDYDVVINGVPVGVVTVVDDGLTLSGQLVFRSEPEAPEELPLDFELPSGGSIEIQQGGVPFFQGTLP